MIPDDSKELEELGLLMEQYEEDEIIDVKETMHGLFKIRIYDKTHILSRDSAKKLGGELLKIFGFDALYRASK